MKSIAIVTGASSGVGREFVSQLCAGKGGPLDEVWAIARSKDVLDELAQHSSTPKVRSVPLDLTCADSFETLEAMLGAEDVCVQWLVNSAGFGTFGSFAAIGRQANANMIQLNCIALVQMISTCLPYVRSGSRIINLASIAGVIPQPYLATYSASKAFVLELSRMLDHELSGTGIHVTALCPKFMRTKFLANPGDAQEASQMTRIGFEDVGRVVSKALAASVLGIPTCITSVDMHLAALAAKILPRKALFRIEDLLFGR